jgi:hypothetical protein
MCACNDKTRPTEVITSQQLADMQARYELDQARNMEALIASTRNAMANAGGGNTEWYTGE